MGDIQNRLPMTIKAIQNNPNLKNGPVITNNYIIATISDISSAFGVTLSGNEKKLYVTNYWDNDVTVINTNNLKVIAKMLDVGVETCFVRIMPMNERAYVFNFDGSITAINTLLDKAIGGPIAVGGESHDIVYSKNETRIYVSNFEGDNVVIVNPAVNRIIMDGITLNKPAGMVLSPKGDKIYVVERDTTGKIWSINPITNEVTELLSVNDSLFFVIISSDSRYLYITSVTGNFYVVDILTKTVIKTLSLGTGILYGLALSPNGKRVYVTVFSNNYAVEIDTTTNEVVGEPIYTGNGPVGIAITSDNRYAYVANEYDNNVVKVDLTINRNILQG